MVRITYVALGGPDAAVRDFEGLAPYVHAMMALQGECKPLSADWAALGIALDAVETAAYHFTRRRYFYREVVGGQADGLREGNGRLGDSVEALAAFKALAAYHAALSALQRKCRPFGRDYLAIEIAKQGLDTAAYHFTREASFYGARGDSAGPTRPAL